ncbi:hypothetical protein IEO21_09217 [Rhodonia placenta]|uniref:Uncharacterized protein n=1 Tax=Rhodonia placenta TaxID=104341 RepID=A0A8H7TY31_9APHY|nr:hypothetical protein IEO21_09217 [Postia placenta]
MRHRSSSVMSSHMGRRFMMANGETQRMWEQTCELSTPSSAPTL